MAKREPSERKRAAQQALLVAEREIRGQSVACGSATRGHNTRATRVKDGALVATLPANAGYTVVVSGVGGATGEALGELYDLPL